MGQHGKGTRGEWTYVTSFLKQSHTFGILETLAREDSEEALGGGCWVFAVTFLLPTEAVCSVLTRRLCVCPYP